MSEYQFTSAVGKSIGMTLKCILVVVTIILLFTDKVILTPYETLQLTTNTIQCIDHSGFKEYSVVRFPFSKKDIQIQCNDGVVKTIGDIK